MLCKIYYWVGDFSVLVLTLNIIISQPGSACANVFVIFSLQAFALEPGIIFHLLPLFFIWKAVRSLSQPFASPFMRFQRYVVFSNSLVDLHESFLRCF